MVRKLVLPSRLPVKPEEVRRNMEAIVRFANEANQANAQEIAQAAVDAAPKPILLNPLTWTATSGAAYSSGGMWTTTATTDTSMAYGRTIKLDGYRYLYIRATGGSNSTGGFVGGSFTKTVATTANTTRWWLFDLVNVSTHADVSITSRLKSTAAGNSYLAVNSVVLSPSLIPEFVVDSGFSGTY